MVLDLLGRERLGGQPPGLGQQRAGEVGQADMPRQPVALDAVQCADAFGERDRGIGPVKQQQVDLRHPELAEALLDRPLQVAVAHALRLHLGGDEEPLAGDAGGGDAGAHGLLVAVALRRIDVGVADPRRRGDDPLAHLAAELPGAQTEAGNGRSAPADRRNARAGRRHAGASRVHRLRWQGRPPHCILAFSESLLRE